MAVLSQNAAAVCPACLERGRPLRLTYERYRLFGCPRCRTQYFRPDPRLAGRRQDTDTASEYWEEYKFDLYANPAVQAGYEQRYDRALRTARGVLGRPIASVLDVGCGIGNFVHYAETRGMAAYGTDVEEKAVRAARDRGLAVATSADLDGLIGEDGALDAVTLWDVIEHLYEPDDVVRSCVARLVPDGVLVLETPDGAFPVRTAVRALHAVTGGRADLTGSLYYWEHKTYFTAAGLRSILRRCGADVVSVRRDTSPKAKMQQMFDHYASGRSASRREKALATAWPLLEAAARRVGAGNKLIVVARKRSRH